MDVKSIILEIDYLVLLQMLKENKCNNISSNSGGKASNKNFIKLPK